jgi:4,4'-diapophytoene synthase
MLSLRNESAARDRDPVSSLDRIDLLPRESWPDDNDFQSAMLAGVSRTFALTIPQLPPALCRVVSNAYLLCRIVDTIEDEPVLSGAQKYHFAQQFSKVLNGEGNAESFSSQLCDLLSADTPPAERELIRHLPRVIRITRSFSSPQRKALQQCIRTMATGMGQFQLRDDQIGLKNLEELDQYCYYVAGVVGEMLTTLFCLHSPEIAKNHDALMASAISFGQGLQMTNILKDVWEDFQRGACWLPRRIFADEGFDLGDLRTIRNRAEFERGVQRLIGITHRHLKDALAYTLLIPKQESGIRNFCLWAIGLALLTLRKINKHRDYRAENQVKISRLSVKATILATQLTRQSDALLKFLFDLASWRLPSASHPANLPRQATSGKANISL